MTNNWNIRVLLDDLAQRGKMPALIAVQKSTLKTLSGEELTNSVRSFASGLLQLGISPGEPIALIGPNSFEWVIARLGLDAAGALAVAIDELATEAEIQAILKQSKARRIVCSADHAEALRNFDSTLDIIAFNAGRPIRDTQRFRSLLESAVQGLPTRDDHSPSMLAYTSGTTGIPKAIVLTGHNVATNVEALMGSHLVGAADRALLPLPLHHVYPFIIGLLTALASGATVVFPESTTGPDILEAIRLADVSAIVGVPRLYGAICSGLMARVAAAGFARRSVFSALIRSSASLHRATGLNMGRFVLPGLRRRFGPRLRLMVSGGARLDTETFDTLIGLGFDVRSGYGLAETASMFTANLPASSRWGSEGKPVAGSVRISAPDQSGVGEIELKGPQIFSHYLDNPEATRAAFTADGWFRTGDLGYVDRDGFLFVTGRVKEMLVLGGGKKVVPEDLERVYGASPYIREIALFEHKGSLAALVVPSLEATRAGGPTHIDAAIRIALGSCAQTLPSYQRLAGFAIVREPLPRTRLGKFRRFLLPQIYENAQHPAPPEKPAALSGVDEALLKQPLARQVYAMLERRYPNKALALDSSPLLDLGIDSLEWISFGLELEESLNLRLSEADIGSVVTVRDLLLAAINAPTTPARLSAESRDWIAPTTPASKLFGAFLYALDKFAMRTLFRLEVRGRQYLPAHGNFVLIANHSSYLDAPAIAASLDYGVLRRCYWAGDPVILFSKRWKWPIMRAIHCFPVNEREPLHALAVSAAILERGDSLVWFPEGWRTPDGKLQSFFPGIGHLLERVPTTVVPAYIDGTFEALPRERSFPRFCRIRVTIGTPINPADWQSLEAEKKDTAQEIVCLLHRTIESLSLTAAHVGEAT